jgi:hypothetical protein
MIAVLESKIFVFSGERLGGTFNQAEAYDPVSNVWAELAPMPMSGPRDRCRHHRRHDLHSRFPQFQRRHCADQRKPVVHA